MKLLMGSIAAVALMFSAQTYAKVDMKGGQALAQKSGCMACHTVDKKLVGPGFKEVAAKYKGNKTAEEMLIAKVTKGGSGTWGTMAMPPQPQGQTCRYEKAGGVGVGKLGSICIE